MNTAKLVKKQVTVHGAQGKMFTRMQWVNPHDASTGHGIRAIHNVNELSVARDHGIATHPEFNTALQHQGISNPRQLQHSIANGYPLFLPETEHTARMAKHEGASNHLPHGTEYNAHEHVGVDEPKDDAPSEHISRDEWDELQNPNKDDMSDIDDIDDEFMSDKEYKESLRHVIEPKSRTKEEIQRSIKEKTSGIDFRDIQRSFSGPTPGYMLNAEEYPSSTNMDEINEGIDRFFKGLSVSAIEHVFSHPDGDYTAKLVHLGAITTSTDGGVRGATMNVSITDPKKGYPIGSLERSVERRSTGEISVYNSIFTMDNDVQGQGIAKHLYARSEQLWAHLAGEGNRVSINMTANIDVGVYAWAKKGFDFTHSGGLDNARSELKLYCEDNKIDMGEALKKAGYNDISELKHAWQFAELDDGNKYDAREFGVHGVNMKLGKAFMLLGKTPWSATKQLNAEGSKQSIAEQAMAKSIETGDYDYSDSEDFDIFDDSEFDTTLFDDDDKGVYEKGDDLEDKDKAKELERITNDIAERWRKNSGK